MLSRAGILKGPSKSLVNLAVRCAATAPSTGVSSENLFRRPVRGEPGKVRLGFVPEEWFTFFYKKTGVTGPYTFGVTVGTYLFSKEWFIIDHDYYGGITLFLLIYVIIKKFGPAVAKFADEEIDIYEKQLSSGRESKKQVLIDQTELEKKLQWSSDGQLLLVEAKRENVALQLEANYRERLKNVYDKVLQRLNYQFEKQHVERRIAQKNLVEWVVKQVRSSITSEQENKNIDKCIADLAVLAKA